MSFISYNEFLKAKICVGTITRAEFKNNLNNPSILLIIDFGNKIGLKKSSAQLRKNYSSTAATSFNSIIATPPTDGIATLSLTNIETAALDKGRYVYDVEISYVDSDGATIIERILEGRIQVTPSVTK